jgi:hypothetical protein
MEMTLKLRVHSCGHGALVDTIFFENIKMIYFLVANEQMLKQCNCNPKLCRRTQRRKRFKSFQSFSLTSKLLSLKGSTLELKFWGDTTHEQWLGHLLLLGFFCIGLGGA